MHAITDRRAVGAAAAVWGAAVTAVAVVGGLAIDTSSVGQRSTTALTWTIAAKT